MSPTLVTEGSRPTMSKCTFSWTNHGETIVCDVEGDHPQFPGDNGGTVDWHQATYEDHRIGTADPSLA